MSIVARTQATGGPLDPDFFAWQTSLPIDCHLLEEDVIGSLAHIQVLLAAGIVTPAEADTLSQGLRTLRDGVAAKTIELPEEEDVHMSVETWLRANIGEVADKLHTGRSRNDQVVTDFMLWCKAAVERFDAALTQASTAAQEFCERYRDTPMPTYTHRQVAIPVPAAMWMEALVVKPLARDRALLDTVRAELAACPLGAGAIAGTTLPTDPKVACAQLGFERPHDNPIDAVGDRDYAMTLVFAATRASVHISRLAADVIELCSDGLIKLSGAIACGSSMMPHKRNPDLFELARAQAALRHGDLTALISTIQGLGAGYHRDFQQDKHIVMTAIRGVIDCLRMVALGLRNITLDEQLCLQALERGDALATDLCEALVARGVPFRQAYVKIGELVTKQREQQKRLVDLSAEDLRGYGLPTQLLEVLDLARSARVRGERYRPAKTTG